jgi:hypothetical protein
MSLHIVQIGKHRFVCGLFWQSLSRPRELNREAIGLARKIDFDLMVLRRDQSTAQAGFAQSRDGARRMMFSLAAAVSKTLALEGAYYDGQQQRVHNWLGAFKLPDGKWAYFAVRDANFLPNGDFAGTKEQVLERLHGDYGLGGWNVVIGDAELEECGFHNFNAKSIQDVLPRTKNGQLRTHKWWGLRPVTTKIFWRAVVATATLVAIAGVGGSIGWQKYQQSKAEAERARALEAERQKRQGKAPASELPHPWASIPGPQRTAQACTERFTHLTAGGWSLQEFVCSPGGAAYTWSRQGSTVDYLLASVPAAVVDLTGDRATYSESFSLGAGDDEALLEPRALLQVMFSQLQLLGIAPRIAKVVPPVQPAPAGLPRTPGSEPPQPDWQTFSFSLSAGGVSPMELATVLSQPGIRIEKLINRNGAWSVEGAMYAK